MLYQRDYLHLLVKYGLEPPSQLADVAGSGEPASSTCSRRAPRRRGDPRRRVGLTPLCRRLA